MTLHKLNAGDGYEYLTRQVAAADSTELGRAALADYYSEKGERPGQWLGRGLEGLQGVEPGQEVAAEQMRALFGQGLHPNSDDIQRSLIEDGKGDQEIASATRLGTPFRDFDSEPSEFVVQVTRAYNEYNHARGNRRGAAVPAPVRSEIRTRIGRETFAAKFGRDPLDERELSAHIARESRPPRQQVAGYDLTFSAVKSVSVLWGTAPIEVAEQIEAAHQAAVQDTIDWLEDEVIFTRRGKGGALHVPVRGLLATAFTHRESRSGDPDLHTHVAISNKVQDPRDGSWLAVDGQVLHKAVVAASERYNTALEREMNHRLGVDFQDRQDTVGRAKRPVREVAGVDTDVVQAMSTRRAEIEAKAAELQAQFRGDHHRAPTPKEMVALYQQANLATRERKNVAHSLGELRERWRHQLGAALPAGQGVDEYVASVLARTQRRTADVTDEQVVALAEQVVKTVEASRARFSIDHLAAETERVVAGLRLSPDVERDAADRILKAATSDQATVSLSAPDTVQDPEILIGPNGRSMFDTPRTQLRTTRRIMQAEQAVIDAARLRGGRTLGHDTVATALLEQVANGLELAPAQAQMVTEMATTDRRVQLCLAPAGSGKTTAMKVLTQAWNDEGGSVLGLAPSAAAASELCDSIGVRTDTLAKLVHHAIHGDEPDWMRQIDQDTLLLIDEAGMASTTDLATAIEYVVERGGTVRLIGDDQQLAAVAAGGVLREVVADTGAVTLSELHRFTDPAEGANTLLLREGNAEALGFLLDRERVHVAGQAEAPMRVYQAWQTDQDAGNSSLMLAHSVATVTELNRYARAAKVAAGDVDDERVVTLADGLRCGAGDLIVTRRNDRRLPITRTDFVKNGDRWRVMNVDDDGGLRVRHESLGRTITLPADYVHEHVDAGYASTIHGAQGQTVDHCHTLITGSENRQLLYVAMSRGRSLNDLVVPLGGDGDPHAEVRPETIAPPTAVDLLEQVIARDGAQVAALTEHREQHDPAYLLARSTERYENALRIAAADTLGAERMDQLSRQAEEAVPEVTTAAAWDTLATHLAVLELSGIDPIEALKEAAASRELDTALDIAAVLDWRLDTSGGHSGGRGPLPWVSGVPAALAATPFGAWLRQRYDQVATHRNELRESLGAMPLHDAPEWAQPLVGTHPSVLQDIGVWRAVHRVPATDTSPTGPHRLSVRERKYQHYLVKQYERVAGTGATSSSPWRDVVKEHTPHAVSDPWWPVFASRLDLAAAVNLPVREHLDAALDEGPLPDEHAAAALWSRLSPLLTPAIGVTAVSGSGAARLRPPWTQTLIDLLPEGVGARVVADSAWPALVASVTDATTRTGWDATDVLQQAIGLIGPDHLPDAGESGDGRVTVAALATVLAWRVGDLTQQPVGESDRFVDEDDLALDEDVDALLNDWANEANEQPYQVAPSPRGDGPEDLEPVDAPHEQPPELGRDRILQLNTEAADYFTNAYPRSPAQTHMAGRFGADPAEHGYLVGYAPSSCDKDRLVQHLRSTCNATDDELLGASLGQWRDGRVIDFFRDRAIVGIRDQSGDVVGFAGRDLSGYALSPKYKNTAATPAFAKRNVLFGLHERSTTGSNQTPRPVLVEGPMDAIAITIASNGEACGIAPGGTALTDAQADLLAQTAPVEKDEPTVWLAYDHDDAGAKAGSRAFDKLVARGITPRDVVYLGSDPAAAWQEHPDTMRTVLSPIMMPLLPGMIGRLVEDIARRHGATHPEQRIAALREAAPKIAAMPPSAWDDAIERTVKTLWPDDTDPDWHNTATAITIDAVATAAEQWTVSPTGKRPGAQAPRSSTATSMAAVEQQLARLRERAETLRTRRSTPSSRRDDPTSRTRERGGPHLR